MPTKINSSLRKQKLGKVTDRTYSQSGDGSRYAFQRLVRKNAQGDLTDEEYEEKRRLAKEKYNNRTPINVYEEWQMYLDKKLKKNTFAHHSFKNNFYEIRTNLKKMKKIPVVKLVHQAMGAMIEVNHAIQSRKYRIVENAIKLKTFKRVILAPSMMSKIKDPYTQEQIVKDAYNLIKTTAVILNKYKKLSPSEKKYVAKKPTTFKNVMKQAKILEKNSTFE